MLPFETEQRLYLLPVSLEVYCPWLLSFSELLQDSVALAANSDGMMRRWCLQWYRASTPQEASFPMLIVLQMMVIPLSAFSVVCMYLIEFPC